MEENQFEGTAKDIGGKIKDGIGGLTGDESLQAEGKTDQLAGKAQKMYGSAKETIGAAADAASESFSRPHYSSSSDTYSDDSMLTRATTMVKEQPMMALLGTAAAGYALAFLLHGGRKRR